MNPPNLNAAAEDLYSATSAWLDYLYSDGETGDAHLEGRLLEAMRAATAKARGESPTEQTKEQN